MSAGLYERANRMPSEYVPTLSRIARYADQFKADKISATRFIVLVGAELGCLPSAAAPPPKEPQP